MRKVVAVSGGVDSVVLLDMLVREANDELIVAHFDHGIRDDSRDDARFVDGLAQQYGLRYEGGREELGKNASELLARDRRYRFLRNVAQSYNAPLVTAHHSDDLVESIAINLERGTGWRGLNVFGDLSIERPLIARRKADIYQYACEHGIEFVEDRTNHSQQYLRNRLRRHTMNLDENVRRQMITLWQQQRQLAGDIRDESDAILRDDGGRYSRYFFTMIDAASALELLWHVLDKRGWSATRPQRERMLLAIKTAAPGAKLQIGDHLVMTLEKRTFIVNQER